MKRALALTALVAAVMLALSGCGRAGLRPGRIGTGGAPAPAATSVTTDGKATGGQPVSSVDNDLSRVDQQLSTIDSQMSQANQSTDTDN
jgi:hypothetical protein